jgi:hypothetical protein
MKNLKYAFGSFGIILYWFIRLLVAVLPFVMIGGNFFLTLLLVMVSTLFPPSSIIFWIWGLVCAINGAQDVWAILFYISFAVLFIPSFVSSILSLFSNNR